MEKKTKILSELYIYIGNYFFFNLKNNKSALYSYQLSLKLGNQFANYFIARILESENNKSFEALIYYEIASSFNHVKSSFKLAVEKLKSCDRESKTIFEKLVNRGCASAMNNLAYLFLIWKVCKARILESFKTFERCFNFGK